MRMNLKNKRKVFKRRRLIFLIVFFLCFSYLFYKISANISYYYLNYSVKEARQIIDVSLASAVSDEVLNDIKDIELYKITKNSSGEIEMIDYDSFLVNQFLRDISDNIANTLKEEETNTDRIAFYIPLGSITQNPLFNSRGPKIPVRMEVIGSVLSSIKTTVKEYGINNCLIEMVVEVEVTEKVILPVITDTVTITNEFPVSYKIIQGKIPTYYGDSINKSSSIYSLPIENK